MNSSPSSSDADALDKFIEQKLKAAGHGLKENSINTFDILIKIKIVLISPAGCLQKKKMSKTA